MDVKPVPQHYTYAAPAPTSSDKGPAGSTPVFKTPVWVTVVRAFQLMIAFAILVISGQLIHGLAMDGLVFALVCGLFTFIVSTYALVVEKAPNCHAAYNYWAILSLDLVLAIFWLSAMGVMAALRASFTVKVQTDYCWDDGSTVNAGHCVVSRSTRVDKREKAAVADKAALAEMAAIAGLCALMMLLFIASLAQLAHEVRLHLAAKKRGADNGTVEMKAQSQPMLDPNAPSGVAQPQSVHPTYSDTMGYPAQGYAPQAPAYSAHAYGQPQQQQQQQQPQQYQQQYQYQQTQHHELPQYQAARHPSQAEMPVSPATFHNVPYQQQQVQTQMYSPAVTPVQGPPYHPPQ